MVMKERKRGLGATRDKNVRTFDKVQTFAANVNLDAVADFDGQVDFSQGFNVSAGSSTFAAALTMSGANLTIGTNRVVSGATTRYMAFNSAGSLCIVIGTNTYYCSLIADANAL